ncbi:MAG: MlaD family protein [Planctomycetia bacterium]|nr:MlaD family protein [Planctomycetia bacterium]
MANRRMEFLIGMTVLVIFGAVAIMTILFGPERGLVFRGSGQRMTIVFEKANGITNNSQVIKSGVEIGRVYKRELVDDGSKSEVLVDFKLNPGVKIFSNEYARISRNLIGDAAVEFVKNTGYTGEVVELQAGEKIYGAAGGDLQSTVSNIEGDLAKALQKVTDAASGLTLFMENLNNFLGTPDELNEKKIRLQNIFTELNDTLVSIKSMTTNMDTLLADSELRENIRKGASQIPTILEKVDGLMTNANTLTEDFRAAIDRSHHTFDQFDKNLDNVSQFTTALAEQGPDFLGSLTESSRDIREMVANIASLAEELKTSMNDHSTPLGMLTDEEVGASLRGIISNAEEISLKLKPVVDNAEVFTNKIAHKPSSLLWGGATHKGYTPTGSDGYAFNFQTGSPTGGLSSSLYRPTGYRDRNPDSYEALYGSSLESDRYKSAASLRSGFAGASGLKCSLFHKGKEPQIDTTNYYGTPFYGTDAVTPMSARPVLTESSAVPMGLAANQEQSGRMKFSLKSPMGGLLKSRSQGHASQVAEEIVAGGVYYVGDDGSELYATDMAPVSATPYTSRPATQKAAPTSRPTQVAAPSELPIQTLPNAQGNVEELPTSVMRPVTPSPLPRPETNFVDDGLPMLVIPGVE